MTSRCRTWIRCNRLGVFGLVAAFVLLATGCASGGKKGWFGSKEPEPPQTIADFMKQPRPK